MEVVLTSTSNMADEKLKCNKLFSFFSIHLVLPKFGPEPKFEPELWRTGPKFSPRFRHQENVKSLNCA